MLYNPGSNHVSPNVNMGSLGSSFLTSKTSAHCRESVLPSGLFSNRICISRYTSIAMQNCDISNRGYLYSTHTHPSTCVSLKLKLKWRVHLSLAHSPLYHRFRSLLFRQFCRKRHTCHDFTPRASLGLWWSKNTSCCCSSPIVSIPLFFSIAIFRDRFASLRQASVIWLCRRWAIGNV